jgi:hypothetical protein
VIRRDSGGWRGAPAALVLLFVLPVAAPAETTLLYTRLNQPLFRLG